MTLLLSSRLFCQGFLYKIFVTYTFSFVMTTHWMVVVVQALQTALSSIRSRLVPYCRSMRLSVVLICWRLCRRVLVSLMIVDIFKNTTSQCSAVPRCPSICLGMKGSFHHKSCTQRYAHGVNHFSTNGGPLSVHKQSRMTFSMTPPPTKILTTSVAIVRIALCSF